MEINEPSAAKDLYQKIDKSVFRIIRTSKDWEDENRYWMTKSPQERLLAIEYLRQQYIRMQNLPPRMDKTIFAIHRGK